MAELDNKRILIMIWILIGVLLLVNCVVAWRIDNFEVDCVEEYDVEGPCPCESGKTQTISPNFDTINLTILENLGNNVSS